MVRHWQKMVGNADRNEEDIRAAIGDELGDVVICAAKIAAYLGLDLDECTARKFNKTSVKNDFPHRIAAPNVPLEFKQAVGSPEMLAAWEEMLRRYDLD